MKGLIKIIFLFLCCYTSKVVHAQSSMDTAKKADSIIKLPSVPAPRYKPPVKPRVKPPKSLRQELSFGARLNSDGWSGFADYGKSIFEDDKHSDQFYNVKLFQFEVSEKKNPKEIKTNVTDPTSGSGSGSSYIYGKINNFYAIKLGYGFRRMIAGKPDPGTVSIHWVVIGGLSVGLLKPYYVKAIYNGAEQPIRYVDSTKNAFLTQSDILGAGGFGQGWSEVKIIPGLHVKTALHFDFSTNRKNVIGLETGVNGELYMQAVPLMANQKATPAFFNVYVGLQFGKRW